MKKKLAIAVLLAVIVVAGFSACDNLWWPEKDKGTLTYNANGGSGTVPAAQTADFRTPITVASPDGLMKSDHSFGGWNTRPAGDGDDYIVGAIITLTGNITLYAKWVENTTNNPGNNAPNNTGNGYPPGGYYYPGSGNTGGSTNLNRPPYTIKYLNGSGGVVKAILDIYPDILYTVDEGPIPENGKDFLGWKDNGVLYAAESKIQVTSNMTFTPVFVMKAVGLEVQNDTPYLTARGEAVYGDYNPDDVGVKQDITILNTSGGEVGPFRISYIERSYDIENASFYLEYTDADGNPSPTPVLHSMRARATTPGTVEMDQEVTPILQANQKVTFRIRPQNEFIPVGTHSLEVAIKDEYGNGATFAMSFTVHPTPLTVTVGTPTYTNTAENALTPIQATIGGTLYTEREASFVVTVSGFRAEGDTDSVALTVGEKNNEGAVVAINGIGFGGGGASDGTTESYYDSEKGKTFYRKIYNSVKVILSDTHEFADGKAEVLVGLVKTTDLVGRNYNTFATSKIPEDITIIDGWTASRPIPVYGDLEENSGDSVRIMAFNYYAGTTNGLKRHFKQMEDIVLPVVGAGQNNWTAIGSYTSATVNAPFTGSYDGNYKTITGITINTTTNATPHAMFGYIDGATIQYLGLKEVTIKTTGTKSGGGIVGISNGGTVKYCYVKDSTIDSTSGTAGSAGGVGGIVVENSYNGKVENCYVDNTDITGGYRYVGGIVGYNRGLVKNCYVNSGKVTGGTYYIGGVVGRNMGNNTAGGAPVVEYCYSTCPVVGYGTVTNIRAFVGGMVGQNYVDAGGATKATARNLVALNPSVKSNAVSDPLETGRVLGENGANGSYLGTIGNNYAWSNMTVNGSVKSGTTTNRDGANITATNWDAPTWWTGTVGFDPDVWDVADGSLPTLKDMPAGVQNPEAP
jgi:hypothetical protein